VAEHDLLVGRLTEDAHVGHAAVRDQVSAAGGIAAVLRADEVGIPLRLLDLAGHGGDHDVAPQRLVAERPHRRQVGDEQHHEHSQRDANEPSVHRASRIAGHLPCPARIGDRFSISPADRPFRYGHGE
jgi:hypothetical protein